MTMDRSRRVAEAWNWLPAFRVVAEYQSIHKAAAVLHISPSALSRTIRLLEEAVGETLFVRSAVGLTLTAYGGTLLEGTREALRLVDDAMGLSPVALRRASILIATASGALLPPLLARVVGGLAGKTCFRIVAIDEALVAEELLRGNVDVALVHGPGEEVPREIVCEALGDLTLAVHAQDGARHGDVVVPDGVDYGGDGRVVVTAPTLDAVARIAGDARVCAVLPIALAPAGFRVLAPLAARVPVYAMWRRPLRATEDPARGVVEAARALLAAPPP